jgi:uncharacterized protein YaiI (UPF0178 family)
VASIWVDADACPRLIREIIIRAAQRTGTPTTFLANHALPVPAGTNISFRQVPGGFDVADDAIVGAVASGDLVITADVPLAAAVVARGAEAVSPRGEAFSADTIGSRLAMRDLMTTLRDSGEVRGGPPPLGKAERQRFAACLDRWLARQRRR